MSNRAETDFLDLLYAAAIDPTLWEIVIARFADMVGGGSGFLSALDVTSGQGQIIPSRIDPEALRLYETYYASRNPLSRVDDPTAYTRDWKTTILTDQDWMPKEELVKTEYYNDFVLRFDSHAAMMVRLNLSGTRPRVLNINRPKHRGEFEPRDLEVAERLHPHVIRAFDLNRKLHHQSIEDSYGISVFEQSRSSLFITDATSKVVRANHLAEELLKACGGLRLIGGRLAAVETTADARLQSLIANAAAPEASVRAGGSMMLRAWGPSAPLAVTIAPLRSSRWSMFEEGSYVLVCFTDLESRSAISEGRLRDIFGLTPTEARVARVVVELGDLPRASKRLGMSLNTAKSHMTRVFAKTGADRQVTLAAMILRVADPEFVSNSRGQS